MLKDKYQTPELLVPAGSLEKLKVAIDYGADAVYLGGLKFGLRAAADNFTEAELEEGVGYAHARDSLVYVVLNGFLHDQDLEELPDFVKFLEKNKVDAVIVSDLGVIKTIQENTNLEIHLSTQASCLNVASAAFWKEMGVTRIVVGREVSLDEVRKIKAKVNIEVEMFIHGSMCMAYSGNCTISNYTQGRDSNRGGCAHSCRFEYTLEQDNKKATSFFMSSKDLNGLSLIPQFAAAGVDSIKVEGRMKSHLYAGTVAKVYSEALSYYRENGGLKREDILLWESELKKFTHRDYAAANLVDKADESTIYSERENESDYGMLGRVLGQEDNSFIMQVRHSFVAGQKLEILPFNGRTLEVEAREISNLLGETIQKTKPSTLVRVMMDDHSVRLEENFLVRGMK